MEKTYKILKVVLLVLVFIAVLLGAKRLYDTLGSRVQMDTLATQATQPAEENGTEPAKQTAPDFTVYDVEGNPHKLSDFRGKPVILNFWATWCGFCEAEMPDFDEKFRQYGDQIHFLMVDVTDGQQETVENGEIAAVLVDGEATLKRVRHFGDRISLEPENPMYRPLIFWGEEMNQVQILGKAVAFTAIIA